LVFGNRVLRRIFGHKKEEKGSKTYSMYGTDKKCMQNLYCRAEGKKPLGRPINTQGVSVNDQNR
jgi:hypothetical protein